jgi:hypothetical protein
MKHINKLIIEEEIARAKAKRDLEFQEAQEALEKLEKLKWEIRGKVLRIINKWL